MAKSIGGRPHCIRCEAEGSPDCRGDCSGITIVQLIPLSGVGQVAALGSDGELYYSDITATSDSRSMFHSVSRIPWTRIPVKVPRRDDDE